MEVRHILHKFATMDYDDNDSGDWYGNTASPDDMMWTDYDYHQNTGELGDLFDDEEEEEEDDHMGQRLGWSERRRTYYSF